MIACVTTHGSHVRDALHWPGAFRLKTTQEELRIIHTPDANDLRQRLMNNLAIFCPSLNCLHAACETHCTFILLYLCQHMKNMVLKTKTMLIAIFLLGNHS